MAWWDKAGPGLSVTRAAVVLAAATTPIFNIFSGRILLTQIVGVVTVIIGGGGPNNVLLQSNPTLATIPTSPLCALLNINAYTVGSLLSITGVPTDAMLPPAAAGAGAVPAMTMELILPIGVIEFVDSLAAAGGAVQWTIWYKPLDDGAYVVAS